MHIFGEIPSQATKRHLNNREKLERKTLTFLCLDLVLERWQSFCFRFFGGLVLSLYLKYNYVSLSQRVTSQIQNVTKNLKKIQKYWISFR